MRTHESAPQFDSYEHANEVEDIKMVLNNPKLYQNDP